MLLLLLLMMMMLVFRTRAATCAAPPTSWARTRPRPTWCAAPCPTSSQWMREKIFHQITRVSAPQIPAAGIRGPGRVRAAVPAEGCRGETRHPRQAARGRDIPGGPQPGAQVPAQHGALPQGGARAVPVPVQSVESRAAAAGGPGRHPGDLRGAGGGPRHEARVVPQQGAAPLQVQLHPRVRLRLRGAQHHQGGRTDLCARCAAQ